MIYLDKMGHLAADSIDELHAFAAKIGLRREWFQEKGPLSHYDCTVQWRKDRAIAQGATAIPVKEMPAKVRAMNQTAANER